MPLSFWKLRKTVLTMILEILLFPVMYCNDSRWTDIREARELCDRMFGWSIFYGTCSDCTAYWVASVESKEGGIDERLGSGLRWRKGKFGCGIESSPSLSGLRGFVMAGKYNFVNALDGFESVCI